MTDAVVTALITQHCVLTKAHQPPGMLVGLSGHLIPDEQLISWRPLCAFTDCHKGEVGY